MKVELNTAASQAVVGAELKTLDNTVAGNIIPATDTYATPAVGAVAVAGLLLVAFLGRKRIASGFTSAKEAVAGLFKKEPAVAE